MPALARLRAELTKSSHRYGKKRSGFANTDVAAVKVVVDPLSKFAINCISMSFSPLVSSSRREFFRAVGRYGLLSALGVIAGILGRRQLGGQRCVNQGLCGGCAVFANCGLPQALSAKAAKGEQKYGTSKA